MMYPCVYLLLVMLAQATIVSGVVQLDDEPLSVNTHIGAAGKGVPVVVYVYSCPSEEDTEDCIIFSRDFIRKVLKSVEWKMPILKAYTLNCKKAVYNSTETERTNKYCLNARSSFHLRILAIDGRTDEYFLNEEGPKDTHPQTLFSDILKTVSLTWKNYIRVRGKEELQNLLNEKNNQTKDSQRDLDEFLLCFSESSQHTTIGASFCEEAGNALHNSATIVHVENKHVLGDIKHTTESESLKTPYAFGLWLISCGSDITALEECHVHKFYGKPDVKAIVSFWNCAKLPAMSEMTANGLKSVDYDDNHCNILYLLHESSFGESLQLAHSITSTMRGSVSVIMLHVGKAKMLQVDKYASPKELDTISEGPIFKLHLANPTTGKRDVKYVAISGDPVTYIRNILEERADLAKIVEEDSKGEIVKTEPILNLEDDEQDDQVEKLLQRLRVNTKCFHCPPVNHNTHKLGPSYIKKFTSQKTHTFVLFWLNVDTMSRAVFYLWGQSSLKLYNSVDSSKMATVACHDHPYLCDQYDVLSWPQVQVFRNGIHVHNFNGVFDEDAINTYIKLFDTKAPIELKSLASVLSVQTGQVPGVEELYPPAITVGLFRDCSTPGAAMFREIAAALQGRYVIALACDDVFLSWVKNVKFSANENVVIVTYRPKDPIKTETRFEFDIVEGQLTANATSISSFIIQSSRPIVTRLTELSIAPVMTVGKIPAILVGLQGHVVNTDEFRAIGNLAVDKEYSSKFHFCYLEKTNDNVTLELIKAWGVQNEDLPALIVVDNINGLAHRLAQLKQLEEDQVSDWLLDVYSGKSTTYATLPSPEFHKRRMIDDQKEHIYGMKSLKNYEVEESNKATINEDIKEKDSVVQDDQNTSDEMREEKEELNLNEMKQSHEDMKTEL